MTDNVVKFPRPVDPLSGFNHNSKEDELLMDQYMKGILEILGGTSAIMFIRNSKGKTMMAPFPVGDIKNSDILQMCSSGIHAVYETVYDDR